MYGVGDEEKRIVQNVLEHTNGDIVVSGFQVGCGWTCGPFVARIDPDGNMLWVSEWTDDDWTGTGTEAYANDMVIVNDGGIVYTGEGFVARGGDLLLEAFLRKVDANGQESWHVRYELDRAQIPQAMVALENGGFLISGIATRETSAYRSSPFLLRTDAEGNLLWYREEVVPPASAGADYEVYNLAVDDDGTVAILYNGSAVEYVGSVPLIRDGDFLAQLTPDGDLITQTRLESLYTFGLAATGRGTWLVSGTIAVPGAHPMLLTEIDKNGKILH
jgi:outer membrane protein assembly factor BamB